MDSIYRVPSIPHEPTKVFATAYIESGGGMAANASVAAQRLGARVSYCGRVGADAIGERILHQLVREGVDVERARRVENCASPSATILIDDAGERLVCIYNDPSLDSDSSWLSLDDIASFDAVLADVRWPEGSDRVFEYAHAARVPCIFDGDVGDAAALRELSARCDYAIFSAAGLALASGSQDSRDGLELMHRQAPVVGVTLGALGFAWIEGGVHHVSQAPRIDAVDTLAAGDVFHGAFALAIGEGKSVAQAARFANAAAGLKCTRFGGRLGAPSRSEVDALLSGQGAGSAAP